MQVTLNELIPLLAEKAGAFPISFTACTRVKLNKFSRPDNERIVPKLPDVKLPDASEGWKLEKEIDSTVDFYPDGMPIKLMVFRRNEPKVKCPFGEVWKTAKVSGWLNCSYANAVEKETGIPYVPGETWHDAALDVNDRLTPFSEDPRTGKLYLRVMRPKTLSSELSDGLAWEQLAPYLPPPPAKEQVVGFRTYGLDGLVDVTFGGQTCEIVGTAATLADAEQMAAV